MSDRKYLVGWQRFTVCLLIGYAIVFLAELLLIR